MRDPVGYSGAEVERFEAEFAAYCGVDHAVGVANGTDALELALRASECGAGDEVATVANAGFYTTSACLLVGATPVFVDIDERSMTMSPESLKSAITPRTKAVVVTHLYGQLADMTGILKITQGKSIVVIEDRAQAHGAQRHEIRAGALGDVGTFSFYPTKNLGALGDGGAVITRRAGLASRLRRLRQYGWTDKYRAELPRGRNSRLDEMQAAILCAKLPHLDAWNARRREIIGRYRDAAHGTPLRIEHNADTSNVGHLCVARHPERDAFQKRAKEAGVETAIHYPTADCNQPALQGMAWRAAELPNARRAIREIVSLPCFPELREEELAQVARSSGRQA